ncbi:MAG: hypothetical protein R3B13_29820 [Polyangiaceae bacterium]
MSQSETLKLDVRVRERLLARGQLDPKEVESYLQSLQDREADSEALELQQPALSSSHEIATVPTTGSVGAEAGSDEDLEAP